MRKASAVGAGDRLDRGAALLVILCLYGDLAGIDVTDFVARAIRRRSASALQMSFLFVRDGASD